jgi:stearoyl-CoA desaturase (delta-9 desaturase)
MHNDSANLLPFVPDLRKDRFHVWISRWHWVPITALGGVLLVAGGWKFLLWGIFFRAVLGLHSTWLVNSATHMWGSRRYPTGDTSRNSLWVALLTFGEGWHNNHHAHPGSSRHGLAWYELDLNWYVIATLRTFGLTWDVKARSLTRDKSKERAALQGIAALHCGELSRIVPGNLVAPSVCQYKDGLSTVNHSATRLSLDACE